MNKDGIAKKVKDYVRSVTFSSTKEINDNLLIFEEGILDSMGLVGLISFLEEEFKIHISDSDLIEENFQSINAVAQFVLKHMN